MTAVASLNGCESVKHYVAKHLLRMLFETRCFKVLMNDELKALMKKSV